MTEIGGLWGDYRWECSVVELFFFFLKSSPCYPWAWALRLSSQGVGTRITHIPRLQPGTFPRLVDAIALAPGWV